MKFGFPLRKVEMTSLVTFWLRRFGATFVSAAILGQDVLEQDVLEQGVLEQDVLEQDVLARRNVLISTGWMKTTVT